MILALDDIGANSNPQSELGSMATARLKPSTTETSKKSWLLNLYKPPGSDLASSIITIHNATDPLMVNSARVGPAEAGEVQLTPPWQLPVWQFPSASHPVLPQMRPLYPEGKVTVLCPSKGPSVKPPSDPPSAAGKMPGSTGVEQKFTMLTELKGGENTQNKYV